MKKSYELGQEQFDALLGLFSTDREKAGDEYERIRSGLERFFYFKGCADPQSLADDTINRVAVKIHTFDPSKNVKPASFFYGFASNILMEDRRSARKEIELGETQFQAKETYQDDETGEARLSCLRKCMERLRVVEKDLIVRYFARRGPEKMKELDAICRELNCTARALHTRVFRIKNAMKDCITECVKIGM